jgi:O-acetyl-ADP-ribose deacetylase (regulator of RNase III)
MEFMPADRFAIGRSALECVQGDITKIPTDAMVNAANSQLAGGGGVDGAIHRAGGSEIMRELDIIRAQIGRCETGTAVVTTAGKLPAKYVFHAVGPVFRDGQRGEPELLRSCYTACLDLAAERGVQMITFPSISTGLYGYPVADAARIAVTAVLVWLRTHASSVETVKLVQFSEADHRVYSQIARELCSGVNLAAAE